MLGCVVAECCGGVGEGGKGRGWEGEGGIDVRRERGDGKDSGVGRDSGGGRWG